MGCFGVRSATFSLREASGLVEEAESIFDRCANMSWLLFLDESGHDHKTMPFEVRGGVALHSSKLWQFELAWSRLEESCFGASLHAFGKEVKGCNLLNRERVRWAFQDGPEFIGADQRRKLARSFLTKGLEKKPPARSEFTAYGQACWEMAVGILELLSQLEAVLFASMIPRGVVPPGDFKLGDFLRKDHVFLLERYFYFLEEKREHGILVMDQVEKKYDRKFVAQMQAYFTKTSQGRLRSNRVVPSPFFVSSEMTHQVQAADVCIYAINCGFRLPQMGDELETRSEIAETFGPWLSRLQFRGTVHGGEQSSLRTFGIVYVPDPFEKRDQNKKGGNVHKVTPKSHP